MLSGREVETPSERSRGDLSEGIGQLRQAAVHSVRGSGVRARGSRKKSTRMSGTRAGLLVGLVAGGVALGAVMAVKSRRHTARLAGDGQPGDAVVGSTTTGSAVEKALA